MLKSSQITERVEQPVLVLPEHTEMVYMSSQLKLFCNLIKLEWKQLILQQLSQMMQIPEHSTKPLLQHRDLLQMTQR